MAKARHYPVLALALLAPLLCGGCDALHDLRTALVANRYVADGTEKLAAEQLTEAVQRFDRARELRPNDAKLARLLALRYALVPQADKAVQCLAAAAEDDADLSSYAQALGEQTADDSRRIEIIVEALTPPPHQPSLLIQCAVRANRVAHTELAIALLKKAAEAAGDDAVILNNAGYLLADWGLELDEALRLTKKADALEPNRDFIMDSVGWAYFRKGMLNEALPYLERAARQAPESAEIRYHLGMLYKQLGRSSDAAREFGAAVRHDENLSEARRELNELRWELPQPARG